jgi:hypothetical protein
MLLHDVSQTALAAAVLTLGLVILLELRSFKRLRRSVDINLGRVFEQLEMLRAESRKMLEAQAQAVRAPRALAPAKTTAVERQTLERSLSAPAPAAAPVQRPVVEPTALDFLVAPPIDSNAYLNASALAAHGLAPAEIAARCGLPAGEARLLASLASARVRRDPTGEAATAQAASGQAAATEATAPAAAARGSGGG